MGIPAALNERVKSLLAPASLEVFNGFYMLQMITPGTGTEELCRSVVLPGCLYQKECPLEVRLQERVSKGWSVLVISRKQKGKPRDWPHCFPV